MTFSPSPAVSAIITAAQRCPHNWFGKQLAQVLRKLVLLTCKQPVDALVGPIRMRCYLDNNVSERKFLFMPWLYDQRERELIKETLPGDGVFIDIGANAGIYSLWACQYLSADGILIAIEPNPAVYERLLANLELNRDTRQFWPKVRTFPVAISDREGMLDMNLDGSNLGGGSLIRHRDAAEKITVQARPLLSVLTECGIERIDILKIDIEGAEDTALVPFLENAEASLLPRYMIIENSENDWQTDLVSQIKSRGYEVEFRTRMNTVWHLTNGTNGVGDGLE